MNKILCGDALEQLKAIPSESVDMCVTSPPYYALRDYGVDGQIGLEETPEAYIQKLVDVFHEVKRVLKADGTLWLNIADSYCGTGDKGNYKDPKYADGRNGQSVSKTKKIPGIKSKDLIGIPWLLAFALRADGWYLRQDIIWAKPNPMPESVTDRCTKSHEYIFLLSKSPKYYFDYKAIQEVGKSSLQQSGIRFGGSKYGDNDDPHYATKSGNEWQPKATDNGDILRNKRDVWQVSTQAITEAHFATFPEKLIEPCIPAGSRRGGAVLDPFFGSGTTGRVATAHGREYIGIELNPEYIEIANKRLSEVQLQLF